jgi:hypothetical protein
MPARGQEPTRPDAPVETKPAPPPPAPAQPTPPAAPPPPATPAPGAPDAATPPSGPPKPPLDTAPPADTPPAEAAPAEAPTSDAPPPEEKPAEEPKPAEAPKPEEPPPPPPEPALETSDELIEPGYLPGYRPYFGVGTSPYAPRLGAFPGALLPGFGAPTPSDSWLFTWSGFMSASLQVSWERRKDLNGGQGKTVFHTPPNVIEEYAAFPSTNSLPGNWIGSNFSYGNAFVTATVSINTWQPTRATQNYGLGSQYFLNDAFLHFRAPPLGKARLSFNVGFFSNSYGALGRYGGGFYTNPMTGSIEGAGETTLFEYDLTDTLVLIAEHGFHGTGGPRMGLVPREVISGTGTAGAGGDPQWPAAYVHHGHLGIVQKGDIQIAGNLHVFSNWSQDDRVQRPADEERCDLQPTPELNECFVRDGRMRVFGADVKMMSNAYGVLGIGGSYIDADYAFGLKGLKTFAGDGERVTSAWFGTRSEGTGKIVVGGISYGMSVASLLLHPEPFNGQAPDVVINAGFNIGRISTAEEPFDGRVRYKFGAEALYTPFRYLGVGFRADRVAPASDNSDQTFHVIAPRLQFKTDWTSHEAIVLSYVKWFFGPDSHYDGLNPRSSENIDDQMFTLNFNMWW